MDTVCASLAFIDGLGAPEMVLIFVIVLVLFGGQKLPEFARGLGKSIREFKKAAAGVEEEFKRALEEDDRKNTIARSPTPALTSGASTHADAGPDAPIHEYDEYGNEISPAADTPTEPAAPVTPTTPVPPGSTLTPSATDAPPPAATTPPAPTPAPAPAATNPAPPPPSVPPPAPAANPRPPGGHPEHP